MMTCLLEHVVLRKLDKHGEIRLDPFLTLYLHWVRSGEGHKKYSKKHKPLGKNIDAFALKSN